MIDTINDALSLLDKREEQLSQVLGKIYSAAQPGAVYGEPVRSGSFTIITACEVIAGGGFGSGTGFGPATKPMQKKQGEEAPLPQSSDTLSLGGGFGGGGSSRGRPVAVIVIGPDKVTVQPIVDVTKVALAGLAAWATMFTLLRKMNTAKKR